MYRLVLFPFLCEVSFTGLTCDSMGVERERESQVLKAVHELADAKDVCLEHASS